MSIIAFSSPNYLYNSAQSENHTMQPIELDIRSLSFLTTSVWVLFAIGMFVFGRMQKKFKGFNLLASANASVGIGMFLLGLRDILPDYITIIVANTLVTASLVFYFEGTRRFLGAGEDIHPIGVIAIIVQIGLFYYYTYPVPSVNNRIIVIAIIMAFLSALCVREFLRNIPDHWRIFGTMMALAFAGYGIFQVYRVIWTLGEKPIQSFMDAGTIHALTFIFVMLLIAGSSFGYIWMVISRLEIELTDLASRDQLTNILNRRGVEVLAVHEFAKMSRVDDNLALILTDIDHFKSINDRFGHQVGDDVLAAFTHLISQNLRPYDVFGRLGGEEFIIILPNTTLEQAQSLAERLRILVETLEIKLDGNEIRITASFGVAKHISETDTLQKLIPFADKAMYQSKERGRNLVTVYSQTGGDTVEK